MSPLTGRRGVHPVGSLISVEEGDCLLHGAGHVISHKRKLSYCHILRAKDARLDPRGVSGLSLLTSYLMNVKAKTIVRREAGPLRI